MSEGIDIMATPLVALSWGKGMGADTSFGTERLVDHRSPDVLSKALSYPGVVPKGVVAMIDHMVTRLPYRSQHLPNHADISFPRMMGVADASFNENVVVGGHPSIGVYAEVMADGTRCAFGERVLSFAPARPESCHIVRHTHLRWPNAALIWSVC